MNSSPSIQNIASALVAFQAEVTPVAMNAKNPFFGSKYADLGEVIRTSTPYLTKNGLSISQFPTNMMSEDGIMYVGIRTILMHSSGEWIEEVAYNVPLNAKQSASVPSDEDNKKTKSKTPNYAQLSGIAISYLRRYAWASILGMYADADTDGNTDNQQSNEDNSDVIASAIYLRKEIKNLFTANPDLQDAYKEVMSKHGYTNATKSPSVMVAVLEDMKQKSITSEQGEK